MYLGHSITAENVKYVMADAIPGNSILTDKLVRFGYKELIAERNNVMCNQGDTIKCHEFHYSDTDDHGDGFTSVNMRGRIENTIFVSDTIWAGYPHLHLWGNPTFADNFVHNCHKYSKHVFLQRRC